MGAVVVEPGVVTVVQLGFDPDNVANDNTDTTSRHFTNALPFDEIDVVNHRNAAERLAAAATLLIKTVELRATAPTALFRSENLLFDTRFICIGSRQSLLLGSLIHRQTSDDQKSNDCRQWLI